MFAPAPIARRASALLIDSTIVALIAMIALVAGSGITHSFSGQSGSADTWTSVLYLVITPLLWASFNVMTVGRNGEHHGQTIGKQLLQLRTVNHPSQDRLTLQQLLGREVLGRTVLLMAPIIPLVVFSDLAALVVLICGLLVVFRADRRSGIDIACATAVVDLRTPVTDDTVELSVDPDEKAAM